jgi:hypothetical protein
MTRPSRPNRRRTKSRNRKLSDIDPKDATEASHTGWNFLPGKNRKFRFFTLILVAISLCAIGYAVVLATRGMLDETDPAKKILELTDQDVDPETTLVEKNLLRQGQIDSRLSIALWPDAKQQLSGDALRLAEQALLEGKMIPILEPLVKRWANDFDSGKAAAFVIWIAEDESQKGNAVELQLNGIPLGKYTIEPSRYAITIVERADLTARLEIKGVSDGNGGTVFRAETATSEAVTNHLSKGKSDSWQIVVR